MTGKLLTVIVPAYNAQDFLSSCLDSLVTPTCAESLDVIVVNDGSKDNTLAIARAYERAYPDIIRCIDKENGGHGSVINTASTQAKGTYLKVLDADDQFVPGALDSFLPKLSACIADVILTPFYTVNANTGRQRPYTLGNAVAGKAYTMYEIEDALPASAKWFTFHGIFFRTDYYRTLNLCISERISYDDTEYVVLGAIYADTVLIDDTYVYSYTIGNDTQSVAPENYARRERHLRTVLDTLLSYSQMEKNNPPVALGLLNRRIIMLFKTCEKVLLLYCNNKKYGRDTCRALRRKLANIDPSLLSGSKLRYALILTINILHIPSVIIDKMYYFILERFGG